MRLPILLLVLLGAFAIGFVARRSAPPEESSPAAEAETTSTPPTNPTDQDATSDLELSSLPPDALLELALERHLANDLLVSATAFYGWLDAIDADAISRQFSLLMAEEDSAVEFPEMFIEIAIERWADLDAESLKSALGDEMPMDPVLLTATLRRDAQAALAAAKADQREACIKYIAARHPSFDLNWARSFGVPIDWFVQIWLHRGIDSDSLLADRANLDGDMVAAIVSHKLGLPGGRDPEAMKLLLSQIEDPDLLEQAHLAIQLELKSSVVSPLKSLQLLDEIGIGYSKTRGRMEYPINFYYTAALSETPDETVDWIMTLDPERRKTAIGRYYAGSFDYDNNPSGWLKLYLRLPPEELPNMASTQMSLRHAGSFDPLGTLDWFQQIAANNHFAEQPKKEKDVFFRRSARQLGESLASSLALAPAIANGKQIEESELRNAVLGGIVDYAIRLDLPTASQLMEDLGEGLGATQRERLDEEIERQSMHRTFRDNEIEAAIEELRAIDAPRRQGSLASSLVHEDSVPFAHRAAVIDAFPEATAHAFRHPSSLINPWAQQAPADAARWLAGQSDSPHFLVNVEGLVKQWASSDVNAAATWLGTLESGPTLDAAAAIIVNEAAQVDPHTAFEWAASIDDPERRIESLRRAALAIDTHATENDEAREAIVAASITDEERTLLLTRLAQPIP